MQSKDLTALPPLPRPVLVPGARQCVWLGPDGDIEMLQRGKAASRAVREAPLVCHARSVARRIGVDRIAAYDVLELFAFVRPAQFCLPTPKGLADVLELDAPADPVDEAQVLMLTVDVLLLEIREGGARKGLEIARVMRDCGWAWAPVVLEAYGAPDTSPPKPVSTARIEVWRDLGEWSEHAPEPPAGNVPVDPDEARQRLAGLVGAAAEARPSQSDYAAAVAAAFQPRQAPGQPGVVLAEAGTGVGKTLGYIAPASLWAEANEGTVWLSTYTRNLQHQIDNELDRLYPDPVRKATKAVIRKGRENYLCLLNFEEAMRTLATMPHFGTALGLMARWVQATRDGDMTGGDFPAWLADILGRGRTLGLADRRGECVYSACSHYHKCFIERSVRRAKRAEIVIANHALVMIQAALGGGDDASLPTRYVFDEGHHVFDAADGAFSAHLSALETVELRRWLLGAETRRTGRARGLRRRVEDLIADDEEALELLEEVTSAANILPGDGWTARLADAQPRGSTETFLVSVRQQVYARSPQADNPYSLETEAKPLIDGLAETAVALDRSLARITEPAAKLRKSLERRLDREADTLDTQTRLRIEAINRSITRRIEVTVGGWRSMLASLATETPAEFVDWFAIERFDGRDMDVGMRRHWIDPTIPFTRTLIEPAHGALVTSATLRDASGEVEADWLAAHARTGAVHLESPAVRVAVSSPFDYPTQTKVFIVGDVRKDDLDQVASAYRELFAASKGGALGLFTAIQRLRAVHQRIAPEMEATGLPLYAQHVDGMDLSTLIAIFRAEEQACLLGTDAVRDGVDVPGESLRLIVFDRVPWPRPDILYRARRAAFGGSTYTDMITRLRLKQAFGRLIRRADDHGVFVLLDSMMPTRLLGAFPEGVEVRRCGLAEAVAETSGFLGRSLSP
jgi:ATP-dependent DNA helicase DinG